MVARTSGPTPRSSRCSRQQQPGRRIRCAAFRTSDARAAWESAARWRSGRRGSEVLSGLIRGQSEALRGTPQQSGCHQRLIRGSSEALQRLIRGSSECNQRLIRGSSEANHRAITGQSQAIRGSSEAHQRAISGTPHTFATSPNPPHASTHPPTSPLTPTSCIIA